jgi:hypothetical protein
MSNHDEQDLLSQAMRDKAAGVGGHPIDMDAVRGRARHIRRRRNAVRGAVAAMVATIAVPSGLAVQTALDSPDGSTPPPVASPTVSDAASPRPGAPVELTLTGLPQGDAAGLPYVLVEEKQLVTPGGTWDLDEAYTAMQPYNDGWIALGESVKGFYDVVMLDADLREQVRRHAGSDTITANQDGTQLAWAERDDADTVTMFNAPADGLDPLAWQVQTPEETPMQVVGFLDEDTVVYQTGGVENEIGTATVGGEMTPVDGFIDVSDASEANGLVAGRESYDDINGDGSCSGVKEPQAAKLLWKRCGVTIGEFSPDGRYVTAYPGMFDFAAPSLFVLDARTGDTVLEFSPEKGQEQIVGVQQVAWEDEDSILAVVVDGDQQGLVRAGLDGTLEAVTESLDFNMDMRIWVTTEPRS